MHQLRYQPRPTFDLDLHYLALLGSIVTEKSPDYFIWAFGLKENYWFGKTKRDPAIDAEVIRLRELGKGFKEIKALTGVNHSSAHNICQAAGLVRSGRHL